MKSKEELPEFEEAMVDWIIKTCQPFTTSESDKFKVMIRSTGYTRSIVKGDTIASRVHNRVEVSKKDLIDLLDRTCVTVALLFNSWTSLNNLSMFAVNSK